MEDSDISPRVCTTLNQCDVIEHQENTVYMLPPEMIERLQDFGRLREKLEFILEHPRVLENIDLKNLLIDCWTITTGAKTQ